MSERAIPSWTGVSLAAARTFVGRQRCVARRRHCGRAARQARAWLWAAAHCPQFLASSTRTKAACSRGDDGIRLRARRHKHSTANQLPATHSRIVRAKSNRSPNHHPATAPHLETFQLGSGGNREHGAAGLAAVAGAGAPGGAHALGRGGGRVGGGAGKGGFIANARAGLQRGGAAQHGQLRQGKGAAALVGQRRGEKGERASVQPACQACQQAEADSPLSHRPRLHCCHPPASAPPC